MHCTKIAEAELPILVQLASDDALDSAYEWLCRHRRDYSAYSDVWALRRDWARVKEQIKNELLSGHGSRLRISTTTPICGRSAMRWLVLAPSPDVSLHRNG